MKIRVEVRHPMRTECPSSNRRRPEVHDRLRGVLVVNGKRVSLPPRAIPFETEADVRGFVQNSAEKIRRYVADDALVEKLAAQLTALADLHRLSPEDLAQRRKREEELLQRARAALVLRGAQ
ncbi:MAG: hypothetical protein JNJ54_04670 [Myxococcaceae bacterium]|nr:hypothetical protein [Myxococcaceae bacterium]